MVPLRRDKRSTISVADEEALRFTLSLVAIAKAVGLALENFGEKKREEASPLLETPATKRIAVLFLVYFFELFA